MLHKISLIIVFFCYCSKIFADDCCDIPSAIQKCNHVQPDFFKCVAKAQADAIKLFKNGYPQKDIDPIEPIRADTIIIKGRPNQQFSLDQKYRNIEIHGFTDVVIKHVNGSFDDCIYHEKLYIPRVEVLSDYEMKGKLLLFVSNGFGKSNVTLEGISAVVTLTCEFFKENDIEYMKFNDLTFKIRAKKVLLDFENLFNGNKELSNVLNKVINENADDLFKEYAEPYAKIIAEQLLLRARKFIKNVPVTKLELQLD